MKKKSLISLFVMLGLVSATTHAPAQSISTLAGKDIATEAETTASVMPYEQFLFEIGPKIGRHFTLEYQAYSLTGKRPKVQSEMTNDLAEISLAAVLAKLRRDLVGFNVVQNTNNPKVIHIIEQAMEQQENYALNQKASITYSGHLVGCVVKDASGRNLIKGEGLVTNISKKVGDIVNGPESNDSTSAFDDCITQVTVNVTNETVRNIITDCIPLDSYQPILWRAVATKRAGEIKTFVHFSGPDPTKTSK